MFRIPLRCQEDAANKPTAAQAYQLSGTATTGHQTFASQLTDGDVLVILAEEIDADGNPAGAWELAEVEFDDLSPGELKSRSIIASNNGGSAIDWSSGTGIDATPRLTAIVPPRDLADGWERVGTPVIITSATTYMSWTGLAAGYDYRILGQIGSRSGSNTGYPYTAEFGYGGTPTYSGLTLTGRTTHVDAAGSAATAGTSSTNMALTNPSNHVDDDFEFDIILRNMGGTSNAALLVRSLMHYATTYGGGTALGGWAQRATLGGNIEAIRIGYGNTPGTNQMTAASAQLYRRKTSRGELPLCG